LRSGKEFRVFLRPKSAVRIARSLQNSFKFMPGGRGKKKRNGHKLENIGKEKPVGRAGMQHHSGHRGVESRERLKRCRRVLRCEKKDLSTVDLERRSLEKNTCKIILNTIGGNLR